jgi:hypothetical protein
MKNNLNKILITSSILSLVFSSAVFFFISNRIDVNEKIFRDNETEWQREADRRDEIRSQNSSIKKIEKEKELLEVHFAKSSNIVPFLDSVEAIGKKVEVKAEVTAVDIPDKSGILNIEMKAVGSFEKLYKFILLLENSSYELEFYSLNIEKENTTISSNSSKTTGLPDWQLNLKMELLSFVN